MRLKKRIIVQSLAISTLILFTACDVNSSNPLASSSQTSQSITTSSSTYIPVIAKNNDYSNPLLPLVNDEQKATYMADPFVIRAEDGLFYLYCTQTEVFENDEALARSHKKGPVFVSDNCVDWTYKADVFSNYTPSWGTNGAGVWAPTVIKIGEYYNFYYSLSTGGDLNPGIGVARSKTPYGPFEHYGKLFDSEEIGVTNSIDPHVIEDEGHIYMIFGSYGGLITVIELTSDGLELKGSLANQRETKVAIAGYERNDSQNYEAAFVLKRNGRYYLFLSTGTCCSGVKSSYHVVVATSDSLLGPYKDSKGRDMFGPNRGDYVVTPSLTGVMGPGHNCIIEDDVGELFMIYHGYDTTSSTKDWRVTYMDRLIFDEKGIPSVENSQASNHVTMAGPYINAREENE